MAGIIDDQFEGRFGVPMMMAGLLLTACGYFLLGGPLLWSSSVAVPWIGLTCVGSGCALTTVPAYQSMLQFALHEEECSRASSTSALFNLVYTIGVLLGPLCGGCLGELVGFAQAYAGCGVCTTLCVLVLWGASLLSWANASKLSHSSRQLSIP